MTIIDMDKVGEALNTKADIDLNNTGVFSTSDGGVVNLTSSTPANASGKEVTSADFFQSNLLNYTTNRILEIPQDIKLELNNGTLTLKAGSKIYVPNGPGVFDVYTNSSDISKELRSHANTKCLVYINKLNVLTSEPISNCFSGTTAPTSKRFAFWYDTTNNVIKYTNDYGSTWITYNTCLPLAIVSCDSNNVVVSIDQIFNGFGYIGSTVFALPGVKVQIPNGRNEDGTFKYFIKTTPRVSTWTWDGIAFVYNIINENGLIDGFADDWHFDYEKNILFHHNGMVRLGCIISKHNHTPRVENFEPYSVDSILNSNLSNLSPAGEAKLKSVIQLVNELPANPVAGVLYCIPEA